MRRKPSEHEARGATERDQHDSHLKLLVNESHATCAQLVFVDPCNGKFKSIVTHRNASLIGAISVQVPLSVLDKSQFLVNSKIIAPGTCVSNLPVDAVVRVKANPLVGGAPQPCMLVKPGNVFDQKILVPDSCVKELLRQNLVEEVESTSAVRSYAWHSGISSHMQWSSLLTSLPDTHQKHALLKQFQKEFRKEFKNDGSVETPPVDEIKPNTSSDHFVADFDKLKTFLKDAARGISLSEMNRKQLAKVSKTLGVSQKSGGIKRTNADLATECMRCLDACDDFDAMLDLVDICEQMQGPELLKTNVNSDTSEPAVDNTSGSAVASTSGAAVESAFVVASSSAGPSFCEANLAEPLLAFVKNVQAGNALSDEKRKHLAEIAKVVGVSQKTGGRKKTASSLAEEILPKLAVIIPSSEGFAQLVSIATNMFSLSDVSEAARHVKKRKSDQIAAAQPTKAELINEVTDAGIMNIFQARQQSAATLQNILDVKQGKKQPAILQMLNATSVELGDRKPVLQDHLEVLRIRVRDETFRTLERLELRELRKLLKVHNVDITTSRQEKIFKKDCLNLLKPQIDKHFQNLVDQQKIFQETDRANAMELMNKTFVNMDDYDACTWQCRSWTKSSNPRQPHSDQPTRGKQLCKQLLDYFLHNHCYPKYTRASRQRWSQLDKAERYLIWANRLMRIRYLKLNRDQNRTPHDIAFLDDVKKLPCWIHTHPGCEPYVPGTKIGNNSVLAEWGSTMEIAFPDMCLLCGTKFACAIDLEKHCAEKHVSYCEYRKRCFYLARQDDWKPLQPQAKRAIIQNLSQFQVACVSGSGINDWPPTGAIFEERREVACATCARLDFLEAMQKTFLFQTDAAQEDDDSSSGSDQSNGPSSRTASRHRPLRVQNVAQVNKILCVRRYAERWPLIPKAELFASSIVHPSFPDMKWLLHTRVVALQPDTFGFRGSNAEEPGSAGVGDATKSCYLCHLCSSKLLRKHPKMPAPALANDMWLGRMPPVLSDLTSSEQMLLCLGRPC